MLSDYGLGLSGLDGVGKHILYIRRVGCALRGEVEAHLLTRMDLWVLAKVSYGPAWMVFIIEPIHGKLGIDGVHYRTILCQ